MKKNRKDNKIIIFVGLLLAAFVSFQFVGANDNELSYFEDRDGDGLSDSEEQALGTDWQNEDTDGDGYTDGVEISSGYNPLVAAPGDRFNEDEQDNIRNVVVKGINKEKVNLTQEFMQKLKDKKQTAISTFQDVSSETGLVTGLDEMEKLKNTSLTEADIEELTNETLQNVGMDSEIELMEETVLRILPKVSEKSDKKKKAAIKKELEEYLAVSGFIMINTLPFKMKESDSFDEKLDKFMVGIGNDIVTGDKLKTKSSKNNLNKAFTELQDIEVPYILKDVHLRTVSLIKYLLEQDESVVFSKNDPIAMGLMIGKLQAAMNEMQEVQSDLDDILLKYDIGMDAVLGDDKENSDKENDE